MNYAVIERKEKENCQKCPHGHGQGGPPVTSIIMMWGANNKVERERENRTKCCSTAVVAEIIFVRINVQTERTDSSTNDVFKIPR